MNKANAGVLSVIEFIRDNSQSVDHHGIIETPPDSLYETMAEAMLDPKLRRVLVHEGVSYTPDTGNQIRVEVLKRSLAAAEKMGWRLSKVDQ